ncbi:hypothetical protein LY76DRAFT_274571 [Colletotrichum caudatum]|nr:hypothetical protein LY76DRAFT_274571 [Colletotrichum caudatum]
MVVLTYLLLIALRVVLPSVYCTLLLLCFTVARRHFATPLCNPPGTLTQSFLPGSDTFLLMITAPHQVNY